MRMCGAIILFSDECEALRAANIREVPFVWTPPIHVGTVA